MKTGDFVIGKQIKNDFMHHEIFKGQARKILSINGDLATIEGLKQKFKVSELTEWSQIKSQF
jgi:hypothetical protein